MIATPAAATTPATAREHAWLTDAAVQLDARGDHALASEARAEAAAVLVPVIVAPVVVRCDTCRKVVKGTRRLADYAALGVDWALCAGCEKAADKARAPKFTAYLYSGRDYSSNGPCM